MGSTFTTHCRTRLLSFAVLLLVGMQSYAQGTWAPLATTAPHYNSGVMLLLTDGSVICKTSSGGTSYGTRWDRLKPNANGSYVNGTWSTLPAMSNERLYFSTQVLNDGRVYLAGGEYGSGGDKGEVYNPLTNTWTATPQVVFSLSTKVSDANSIILANGKVLQAIVDTANTKLNFLWDPATNTYAPTGTCIRRDNEACWLKLPDGSTLFIDNYSTTSERYLQSTNAWINDGPVADALFDPFGFEQGAAFLLPDGRGFFIGSTPTTAYYTPSGTAAPGTWASGPVLPSSQGAPDAAAAMMPNGKILLTLSPTPALGDTFPNTTAYYEFNYLTNTYTSVSAPDGSPTWPQPTFVSNMLSLPDGTILYCNQGDDQYYEYVPGSAPIAAGKPTLDSVIRINCDTFMATGLLFNGISEGAAFGDDWQMSTNYPIVRLTSGTNVFYARTYGWNRMGAVMTGALLDTTMFAIPAGMPAGTYAVQVVANGNPSNTKNYNTSLTITPASQSLCNGATSLYTDLATIGTWSTANPSVATINAATGALTAVGVGNTTVQYSVGSCFSTATVTVNAGSASISGSLNVCQGATSTLTPSPAGGTWTSSTPAIASIGSASGIVLGNTLGTANVIYTIGICTSTAQVTVSAIPVATITAAGPTTFCAGGNVMLNATAGTGLGYQWRLAGSPIAGATNVSYTAISGGNYTVVVTTAAGCAAISAITSVTTLSAPTAAITAAGPVTFCAGASVVLNANPGVGLTYQWQSGGALIGGATAASFTAAAGGNYTVIVTNSLTCTATSAITTVTVTAGSLPITGVMTLCAGATTALSDLSPGGTWSSGTPAVATIAPTGVVTGIGTGGFANITYTLGTGCTATAVVTVNSSVAAPISGPSSVCVGQAIALTDGTPGGTWSSSLPSRATISTTGAVTGVSAGTTIISYVTSSCGSATVTKMITVNANPVVAAITGAVTICSGLTSTLADVTPSGVWSSGNTAVATVSTSGVVSAVAPGASTISYGVTNGLGCTSVANVLFNVFSSISSAVTISGATTFCTGGSVSFTAATGPGMSYQWRRNGTNILGATTLSYTANTSGNYTVFITVSGGCNSLSTPVTVVVNPSPIVAPAVAISASAGPVFCVSTSPATFTAMPSYGGSSPIYQWFVNGIATSSSSSFGYTPVAGDMVKVIMTSNNGCAFPVTVSRTDTISVTPNVAPSVSITSPGMVCTGRSATFTAVPVFGGLTPGYLWSRNGINTGVASAAFSYTPITGDILVVTLASSYPCRLTDSAHSPSVMVTATAAVPNTISVSVTQAGIVAGGLDTFIAIAPFGGTSPSFQWLSNSVAIAGATSSIYVTNSLTPGQVISCQETSNAPCAVPGTVTSGGITVRIIPVGVRHITAGGNTFTLAPNPNKGSFTIGGTLKDQTDASVEVSVTDMLGQSVFRQMAEVHNGILNQQVNLGSNIANGMYLVNITYGEERVVYHVVVDK